MQTTLKFFLICWDFSKKMLLVDGKANYFLMHLSMLDVETVLQRLEDVAWGRNGFKGSGGSGDLFKGSRWRCNPSLSAFLKIQVDILRVKSSNRISLEGAYSLILPYLVGPVLEMNRSLQWYVHMYIVDCIYIYIQ